LYTSEASELQTSAKYTSLVPPEFPDLRITYRRAFDASATFTSISSKSNNVRLLENLPPCEAFATIFASTKDGGHLTLERSFRTSIAIQKFPVHLNWQFAPLHYSFFIEKVTPVRVVLLAPKKFDSLI
jgi:hypothetical protein